MHSDQLQNINPNRLHGCHPLDLHNIFSDHPFHLIAEKPKTVPEKISPRLRILEKILSDILRVDFAAKDHFAEYMRQRYRRNCKPNTLRNAATSLKQFLHFYGMSGKQHIEQMTREDIEAFTEDLQDRGLTPVTVANRLRWVYRAALPMIISGLEEVLKSKIDENNIRNPISYLMSQNWVSNRMKGELKKAINLRNHAIHGLGLVQIEKKDARGAMRTIKKIIDQIQGINT